MLFTDSSHLYPLESQLIGERIKLLSKGQAKEKINLPLGPYIQLSLEAPLVRNQPKQKSSRASPLSPSLNRISESVSIFWASAALV